MLTYAHTIFRRQLKTRVGLMLLLRLGLVLRLLLLLLLAEEGA
jgi:hypothetical protein